VMLSQWDFRAYPWEHANEDTCRYREVSKIQPQRIDTKNNKSE